MQLLLREPTQASVEQIVGGLRPARQHATSSVWQRELRLLQRALIDTASQLRLLQALLPIATWTMRSDLHLDSRVSTTAMAAVSSAVAQAMLWTPFAARRRNSQDATAARAAVTVNALEAAARIVVATGNRRAQQTRQLQLHRRPRHDQA